MGLKGTAADVAAGQIQMITGKTANHLRQKFPDADGETVADHQHLDRLTHGSFYRLLIVGNCFGGALLQKLRHLRSHLRMDVFNLGRRTTEKGTEPDHALHVFTMGVEVAAIAGKIEFFVFLMPLPFAHADNFSFESMSFGILQLCQSFAIGDLEFYRSFGAENLNRITAGNDPEAIFI